MIYKSDALSGVLVGLEGAERAGVSWIVKKEVSMMERKNSTEGTSQRVSHETFVHSLHMI